MSAHLMMSSQAIQTRWKISSWTQKHQQKSRRSRMEQQPDKWKCFLRDVYTEDNMSQPGLRFLYQLLKDRSQIANISHERMPTFQEHLAFVDSHPYHAWYLICFEKKRVRSLWY